MRYNMWSKVPKLRTVKCTLHIGNKYSYNIDTLCINTNDINAVIKYQKNKTNNNPVKNKHAETIYQ